MSEPAISTDARTSARRGARRGLWLVLFILAGIAAALFALLLSSQVYFNATGFAVVWRGALGVGLLAAAAVVWSVNHKDMGGPLFPLMIGTMFGLAALPFLAGFTTLAVFVTAQAPAHFTTRVDVVRRGRCRLQYGFDNPPIGRHLYLCAYSYGGMRNVNVMEVNEKVGPLGVAVGSFVPRHLDLAEVPAR